MTNKAVIKCENEKSTVELGGVDVSCLLSGVDIEINPCENPCITLHSWLFPSLSASMDRVKITNGDKLLQVSAEVVQAELKQKGDWYNALVASIFGYLQETDGSVPYDQMAVELANRIAGIESDPDSIENLDLTVRTYVCLKRAGINTVSQLRNIYSGDLLKINNFTQQSLDELAEKLEKYELLEREFS